MLCALTVRTLNPGTFDDFRAAFMEGNEEGAPEGWVRFNMLRNAETPDEVITFGFYDGTVDELRASSSAEGYEDLLARIAPYDAAVGADGLYEIVEEQLP